MQGVTSEREQNDRIIRKVINHKEPANDLAPKYDLAGGGPVRSYKDVWDR